MTNAAPRIVMTLLVRDEADILAQNIEFHRAGGVDHFIITDNLSTDATPAIIARYVKKGWATSLVETSDDYRQSEWVTRMARAAAVEFDADWVINADADEFWIAADGSLKRYFASVPADISLVSTARHDFAYLAESEGGCCRWRKEMIYRKTVSVNGIGVPLGPKVAHRAHPAVVVHQGNHEVSGLSGRTVAGSELEILHFPIRSRQQFENKIKNGGAAYTRNNVLPPTVARGWRELYRLYCSEGSLQSYLKDHCFTSERIAREIATGALGVDARLATFEFPERLDL